MPSRLIVTVRTDADEAAVRATGVEVLARYPDTMLVRATGEQAAAAGRLDVEVVALEERQPVLAAGNSFVFEDAMSAQEMSTVEPPSGRIAYYLLRLAGPPAPGWLRELRAGGAVVHDSLTDFTLLIGVLPERVAPLAERPWVEAVTPYRAAMKVSPKVYAEPPAGLGAEELSNVTEAAEQLIEVSVFPGESVQALAAAVRAEGGTVLSTTGRNVVASARPADLAGLPAVQAVLPYARPELHNDQARLVLEVEKDNSVAGLQLTGRGQIVAIADSGLDTGDPETVHPDVRGRVAGLVSWPTKLSLAPYVNDPPGHDDGPADAHSGHGTHVTGSVLGDGSTALAAKEATVPAGVAPEAQVYFQAISQRVTWRGAAEIEAAGLAPLGGPWPPADVGLHGLPTDLLPLFEQAYRAGARIHTNSWGSAAAGVYTGTARAVDAFMWHNRDMLILFSAGNSGEDRDGDGVIDPDSVGAPGTAKNCLTVGAGENDRPAGSIPTPGKDQRWDLTRPTLGGAGHVSDDVDGMAAFSSRGPTDDGRIKPDVVAPGTNVLSLLSRKLPDSVNPLWGRLPSGHPLAGAYCWAGGTSMATPLVAGAAALVREHLVRDRGHHPSSALLKAFLVNGAVPMKGQYEGEIPAGPNSVSGFGRVDAARSVGVDERHRTRFADAWDDAVCSGQTRRFEVEATEPGEELRVTLVWTDAPSQEGNGKLVNELYLQVLTPGGRLLDGDVHPFPRAVNNVQQVTIPVPGEGVHEIRVRGVSVTEHARPGEPAGAPRQDFALVVTGSRVLAGER
ncbi:S8 family serine peptidase [Streptomyces sp. NPDC004609]|uniref:S8 family serine peptidase n=1 Tax=Streptomyces sp. NPDC004609 TaxID=3364704 RepID=UPI003684C5C8